MTDYVRQWLQIIDTMSNDNTYKLAWGKALIELAVEDNSSTDIVVMDFKSIGYKMLKYYWNQIFFFDLKQSPGKKPVIVQETEKCIARYVEMEESNIPVWFDYADSKLRGDDGFYNKALSRIAFILKRDVSWRFLKSGDLELPIYKLDKDAMKVEFTRAQINEIKQYDSVFTQLLYSRWAELLERFNSSPRIVSKVKGISQNKLRRNSLAKYRKILLQHSQDSIAVDFYTGEQLSPNDISVDHVIPWSFMYSDDIWNLVLTSKGNNSKKSNRVPSEVDIEKLIARNLGLVEIISDEKMKNELETAIKNDYVPKFYISLRL